MNYSNLKTISRFCKTLTCSLIFLLPICAFSEEPSLVPKSAFYIGAGASYNYVNFYNQSTWGKGTSYQPYSQSDPSGGPLTGSAAGSTSLSLPSAQQFGPSAQIGYFQNFDESNWIWGGKFTYNYIGSTSSKSPQLIPQAGGYYVGNTYTPFTGNYVVRSYQQSLEQQISFVPYFGYSFQRSQLYFGAGPTYTQTKTSINDITGFMRHGNFPHSPTGVGDPSNYSTTQWVIGGTAMFGGTFFVTKNWFVDAGYSLSMLKNKTSSWGGPWTNPSVDGDTRTGTNSGTSSGQVFTQTLMLTLNYAL